VAFKNAGDGQGWFTAAAQRLFHGRCQTVFRMSTAGKSIDIARAFTDRRLFASCLGDLASWVVWFVILKACFAIGLDAAELAIFHEVAGPRSPPARLVRELWIIAGRRSGKSRIAALIAVFLAVFVKHKLAPGERGFVLIVAPTLSQSELVLSYARGFVEASAVLSRECEVTRDELRFKNGITITTASSLPDNLRGRTLCGAVIDEVSYLRDAGAVSDVEIYRALVPALATTQGLLVAISTPRRRSGLLFERHKSCFGVDDQNVLVVQGPSRLFNPLLDTATIEQQRASDPALAASEWDAEFRSDICQLFDDAMVDGAIDESRPLALPRQAGVIYRSFVDCGGNGSSSFSVAVGHTEDGKLIIDTVCTRSPPYNVVETVAQFAALLRGTYGIGETVGDYYAGSWPTDVWRDAGVKYLRATATKSEIYLEALGPFLRGAVSLPAEPRLLSQLKLLERRTRAGGKDVVDAGKQPDDAANACCGVIRELARRRGWLQVSGWESDAPEEETVTTRWKNPADVRQEAMLARARAPVSMVPPDVIMLQLGLTPRQVAMIERAAETVMPMNMRTGFERSVLDRLAPSPADGAVDVAIDLALHRLRREVA
jgi:hypothetical protein